MSIEYETKYSAVYAEVSGTRLDASVLGVEYSVVFHADGTCDLVIAGVQLAGLPYTSTGTGVSINYSGMGIGITAGADGNLVMDYFGTMNITLAK